ncbi:hypothetical protein DITRI_Ditri04bG0082000 [Diplodiscus trichospermus]
MANYRSQIIEELFGPNTNDSTDDEDASVEDSIDSTDELVQVEINVANDIEACNHINVEEGPKKGMVFTSIDGLLHAYQEHKKSKRINCPAKMSAILRNGVWIVIQRIDEHNHPLDSDMSRLMASHRNLTIEMKRNLEANDIAAKRPCKSVRLLEVLNDGSHNLGCFPKDCRILLEIEDG